MLGYKEYHHSAAMIIFFLSMPVAFLNRYFTSRVGLKTLPGEIGLKTRSSRWNLNSKALEYKVVTLSNTPRRSPTRHKDLSQTQTTYTNDLNILSGYLRNWKLKTNRSKTELACIRSLGLAKHNLKVKTLI